MWKSSRKVRSGSAASSARMRSTSNRSSVMGGASGGLEARGGQPQPFQRGAVVQAGLLGGRKVERGDARARFLLAEREGIVGAEHDAIGAAGGGEIAQSARIGRTRIGSEGGEAASS